jgi:site-specific DNA-methyltransferase (adenine-specific)
MIDLRNEDVTAMLASLPDGCAPLVHADPPWQYDNATIQGGAERHYGTITLADIATHIDDAARIASEDAYLSCWCTFPLLMSWARYSTQLKNWEYVTGASWGKLNGMGVGTHFRGDAELLLLYRKGSPRPLESAKSNLWLAPRIGHSEKPQKALRALVSMAAPVGGLVVDLYAGASASLAIACRSLGRQYVGAEIDPARHATALLRLSQQEMVFV